MNEESIIDGLKMFIESYMHDVHICMMHFLIAARKFLQAEKLILYSRMREDEEVDSMIRRYQEKYAKSTHSPYSNPKDIDPFLNELIAYDGLVNCYRLLNEFHSIVNS